jgi:hypothetical protein
MTLQRGTQLINRRLIIILLPYLFTAWSLVACTDHRTTLLVKEVLDTWPNQVDTEAAAKTVPVSEWTPKIGMHSR